MKPDICSDETGGSPLPRGRGLHLGRLVAVGPDAGWVDEAVAGSILNAQRRASVRRCLDAAVVELATDLALTGGQSVVTDGCDCAMVEITPAGSVLPEEGACRVAGAH